jgi:hypothetical protein
MDPLHVLDGICAELSHQLVKNLLTALDPIATNLVVRSLRPDFLLMVARLFDNPITQLVFIDVENRTNRILRSWMLRHVDLLL